MQDNQDIDIESIINEHMGFVLSMAVKYAPAPGLAHDVSQQVFLEFLNKKDHWDFKKDIRPLLAKMTRLVALRLWRKNDKKIPTEMRYLAEYVRRLAESEDVEPVLAEERTALETCLGKLSERGQRLVQARYYLSASSIEIAQSLDMTPNAVRTALFHLRKKLRACVELQIGREGI